MGLWERAQASHCPAEQKETILNEKEKQEEKKRNAHIYNLAAISCLTSLLFICVNSPCSPVSLKCSVPLYTWKCPRPLTLFWWVYLTYCCRLILCFLPLWRLTVYNDTLYNDIKWKPESFTLTVQTPFTGTSKHWKKQSCQQLGTIIKSFCIVSSWVLGLEFYLFKANVNIQCFPQAVTSSQGILDTKDTLHRTQRLICSF